MVLKKVPPILEIGGLKYYTYCPVCGCVANYKITYNYVSVQSLEKHRFYGWTCLDCGSEHCFNRFNIKIKDCLGVSNVTIQC